MEIAQGTYSPEGVRVAIARVKTRHPDSSGSLRSRLATSPESRARGRGLLPLRSFGDVAFLAIGSVAAWLGLPPDLVH